MNETLREINNFFADTANFDKFIEYTSLEEKKGEFLRGSTIVFWKVRTVSVLNLSLVFFVIES